jgi:hypothetical protein
MPGSSGTNLLVRGIFYLTIRIGVHKPSSCSLYTTRKSILKVYTDEFDVRYFRATSSEPAYCLLFVTNFSVPQKHPAPSATLLEIEGDAGRAPGSRTGPLSVCKSPSTMV